MLSLTDKIRASKLCCRKAVGYFTAKKRSVFDKLHDSDWELFVIKKDEQTGEFTWETACCVESPI